MKSLAPALLVAALALSACVPTTLPPEDPRRAELIAQECAIYFAAERQLASEGRALRRAASEGCPPEAAARRADIATRITPPIPGTEFSEILYRRMIARGVPNDLALQISGSPAFWDLVVYNKEVYGR